MESLGIQLAGPFIEQARDQITDPGLAGGILARTAAEGIFHRDQRHGGVLHKPGLDPARRDQMLDLGRSV